MLCGSQTDSHTRLYRLQTQERHWRSEAAMFNSSLNVWRRTNRTRFLNSLLFLHHSRSTSVHSESPVTHRLRLNYKVFNIIIINVSLFDVSMCNTFRNYKWKYTSLSHYKLTSLVSSAGDLLHLYHEYDKQNECTITYRICYYHFPKAGLFHWLCGRSVQDSTKTSAMQDNWTPISLTCREEW